MEIAVSQKTIEVLKNFLSINRSIIINPGNVVSTLSVNKNIMARCQVDETFPQQVAIYDLSIFIGSLNLCNNPVLEFSNPDYLLIKDEGMRSKTRIYYSDPELITSPPDKELALPDEVVNFTLNQEQLKKLRQAASTYNVNDLCVYSKNGILNICVTNKKNETSHAYSIELGEVDGSFCFCMKIENLNLIPETYDVTISDSNVCRFVSKSGNLKYWVALEPDSSK